MNKKFDKLEKHFIDMSMQQTMKMLPIYNCVTERYIAYDYSLKGTPLITLVIPIRGRKDHLYQSLKCLNKQVKELSKEEIQVQIIVSEMSEIPTHKDICKKLDVGYIHTKHSMFSKSIAMNQAARLFPSEAFIFYDVDLVVGDLWLRECVITILAQYKKGSTCWISQPIPGRKIYYVNEKNTNDIFSNKKNISEIQIKDHMVQPSWFQGNYPPGGVILVTANLFYAVQGYDYSLFWDYSPEDLSFLKNALSLSDSGELITWEEEKLGCNVYHLHHTLARNENMSYEHMVFADNIMDGLDMRMYYLHDKLRYEVFGNWNVIDSNRFPSHIFAEAQDAFHKSKDEHEFKEAIGVITASKHAIKQSNPAVYKLYVGLLNYLMKTPVIFNHYRF
jgi:hypothetical protein